MWRTLFCRHGLFFNAPLAADYHSLQFISWASLHVFCQTRAFFLSHFQTLPCTSNTQKWLICWARPAWRSAINQTWGAESASQEHVVRHGLKMTSFEMIPWKGVTVHACALHSRTYFSWAGIHCSCFIPRSEGQYNKFKACHFITWVGANDLEKTYCSSRFLWWSVKHETSETTMNWHHMKSRNALICNRWWWMDRLTV